MRSRRDDHHLGRAESMIAFLGSVRALAATRRYANIRGARHHGLDRGPGRRRRDPHPASATAPRIVPAPRLVWTRPRGSPRCYYRGICPKVAGVVRVLLELNMAHEVIALIVRGLLRVARS